MERVYKGSVSMMMNTLVRRKDFNREEIAELYDILREIKKTDDWTPCNIYNIDVVDDSIVLFVRKSNQSNYLFH